MCSSVQYNFTGWIIGWHGTTGQIVEKFATEGGPEDKKGGGVWMSGGGIAQDSRMLSKFIVILFYGKVLLVLTSLGSQSHVLRYRKWVCIPAQQYPGTGKTASYSAGRGGRPYVDCR